MHYKKIELYVYFLLIPPACSKYKNIEPIPNEAIIEGEFNSEDGKMHFIKLCFYMDDYTCPDCMKNIQFFN